MSKPPAFPYVIAPLLDAKAVARFWSKVDQSDIVGCWPWTSACDDDGYPVFWLGGRTPKASHVALEIDGKVRPTSAHALHACDTPLCVRPSHLRWGTNAENVADKVRRGRVRKGTTHPCATDQSFIVRGEAATGAKLTTAQVLEIYGSNENHTAAARRFNVSLSAVSHIRAKKSWVHVVGNLPDWRKENG